MRAVWIGLLFMTGCGSEALVEQQALQLTELKVELAEMREAHDALRAHNETLEARIERLERAQRRAETAASADALEGIEEIGELEVGVEAAALQTLLADPDKVAGMMRVIPHKNGQGELDGFRLSGIRRGTLIEGLGLRNGDILHAVNGLPVTSVEEAMAAHAQLPERGDVRLKLTRRSVPAELVIHIR